MPQQKHMLYAEFAQFAQQAVTLFSASATFVPFPYFRLERHEEKSRTDCTWLPETHVWLLGRAAQRNTVQQRC